MYHRTRWGGRIFEKQENVLKISVDPKPQFSQHIPVQSQTSHREKRCLQITTLTRGWAYSSGHSPTRMVPSHQALAPCRMRYVSSTAEQPCPVHKTTCSHSRSAFNPVPNNLTFEHKICRTFQYLREFVYLKGKLKQRTPQTLQSPRAGASVQREHRVRQSQSMN